MTIAERIRKFSACFRESVKIWRYYYGLPENSEDIKNDSLYAIQHFAAAAHERRGKNPEFPKYHIIAIKMALDGRSFDEAINDKRFPDKVWRQRLRMWKLIYLMALENILERLLSNG